MKRLRLTLLGYFFLFACMANAADIYVSPTGSDFNDGSKEKPLASVNMALRKVREMRRLNVALTTTTIRIIVSGGTYRLKEPIFIRPEDSGLSGGTTIIMAATGEEPILSGGIRISGWKKLTAVVPGLSPKAKIIFGSRI